MDNLLKSLLMSDGISGYEENAGKIMTEALSKVCIDVKTDSFGNVIAKGGKIGAKKKIQIAAHLDEIGMVVKHITRKGFIYFIKIGGISDTILPGKTVNIINRKGKHIVGIIGTKPPHLMSAEEAQKPIKYENMFIDIGLSSKEEVLKKVEIGDQIIFEPSAGVLNGDFYYGKAADNRISCYAMVKVMEEIAKKNIEAEIFACATAQEEVGLKGGKTSSFKIDPDFALVIDTTIAGDIPAIEEKVSGLKLGQGVAITIIEASGRGTIVPQKIRNLILSVARENKIPHQVDIIEGGMTDAAVIYTNRQGILTGILSIPTRYIHAPASVFNIKDVEAAVALSAKTIEKVVKEL
ncbi:MAG: M42 family metallopeptidase [Elusimicrobiota bacterium]|nr:M42 family metallopeptidase [Elusimicrobiota bacterium]